MHETTGIGHSQDDEVLTRATVRIGRLPRLRRCLYQHAEASMGKALRKAAQPRAAPDGASVALCKRGSFHAASSDSRVVSCVFGPQFYLLTPCCTRRAAEPSGSAP